MHPWWSSKIGLLTIQPAIFLMLISLVAYPFTAGEAFGQRGFFFGMLFLANGLYVGWMVLVIFRQYASDLPDEPDSSSGPSAPSQASQRQLRNQPQQLAGKSEVKRLRAK